MPCIWVERNNSMLSMLSSYAEVALGFLLVISLLSYEHLPFFFPFLFACLEIQYIFLLCNLNLSHRWQRSLVQAFMYWNVSRHFFDTIAFMRVTFSKARSPQLVIWYYQIHQPEQYQCLCLTKCRFLFQCHFCLLGRGKH